MARQRVFESGVLSRRHFLRRVGASGVLLWHLPGMLPAALAEAAAPQPGGVARVRGYDPLGWDPMLSTSYRTHIAVSYTHNRLFRYKPGPDVAIGTMMLEPDLVERWEEPSDTRYILHLRQGVHFHDKPPVGGRAMTAEDVRYSLERFLTVQGNSNRSLLEDIDKVEVLAPHTVQLDLKRPNIWLLDYMADASILPIIAKEAVEEFGDLKQPEAVIGTGPWYLETYEPKVKSVFKKNPKYFRQGLPYFDEVQLIVIDDNSTASAAYMSEQLDFGWGFVGTIRMEEMEEFKTRHPDWHYEPFLWNVPSYIYMHTDQPPFNDQRVRQAISMAINRQEMIEALGMGHGAKNTVVPAALREWHLPVDELGEGAKYYQYNPDEARRLLKEAGHARGFKTSMMVFTGYSSLWADIIDLVANYLREVGIEAQITNKEYGAYIRSLVTRDYEGMVLALKKPYVIPDGFIHDLYVPDRPSNLSFVNDPEMERLARAQRREKDRAKRKAIIDELSRQAAVNQYYIHLNSSVQVASWPPYVNNFNTNLGYDYGGRMEAAWFAKS